MFALTVPRGRELQVDKVSDRLRQRGWLVPACSFPENREDLNVLRIVIRAGMNFEIADLLLQHCAS